MSPDLVLSRIRLSPQVEELFWADLMEVLTVDPLKAVLLDQMHLSPLPRDMHKSMLSTSSAMNCDPCWVAIVSLV